MGGDKVSVPAVEDELHIERCRPTSSRTCSPSSAPSMTSCFQLLQAPSLAAKTSCWLPIFVFLFLEFTKLLVASTNQGATRT